MIERIKVIPDMDYKANIDIQADFTDRITSEAVASSASATGVVCFQGAFDSPSATLRHRKISRSYKISVSQNISVIPELFDIFFERYRLCLNFFSLDEGFETSGKGIRWMNLVDFLGN